MHWVATACMTDADAVINCVGILVEEGKNTFGAVHDEAAGRIARLSVERGVARMVHVSALGADAGSDSLYAASKARGEAAVRVAGDTLVLRVTVKDKQPAHRLVLLDCDCRRGDGEVVLTGAQRSRGIELEAAGRVLPQLAVSAAYALHPAFGEAEILETGADARPAFPDNLPRIGQAGGRLYANGLYRHGYLLAPAVAMQLADHIDTGAKPEFWHETDHQR